MAIPEDMISVSGQHALQDMVELQMYLVAQSQQTPWPLLPRRTKQPDPPKKAYCTLVESSAVAELIDRGLIEATSNRTFVVSKSGHLFYERKVKSQLA